MIQSKYDRKRLFFFVLVFTLSVALSPSLVSGQTVTGTLQGTVSDSKGAVIPCGSTNTS